MNLRILSDLHLEFMADGAASFVESLREPECDVLVLAGDIGVHAAGLEGSLRRFCNLFPHVVYVAGNHEFYGSSPAAVERKLGMIAAERTNFHWLENSACEIDGQRFVGCTLWYRQGGPEWWMNDFGQIRGFAPWVYDRCEASRAWLAENVRPGNVVVTHMLPHEAAVHPKYKGLPSNCFFLTDQSRVIADRKPALWAFGHTHESIDAVVGETRLVCNPHGYFGHEVNAAFDPGFTVEVSP